MENKATVPSLAIRYGLITGLVLIIYSAVLQITGLATNQVLGYVSYLFLIGGIIMAIKGFKNSNDGYMSFAQGLGLGSILSGIAGLLSAIFMYVYIKFIDNSFIEKIQEIQIAAMEEKGMSDEEIDQAMEIAGKFMTPEIMFIFGILGMLFIGFILSLIISAIMKNEKPELGL